MKLPANEVLYCIQLLGMAKVTARPILIRVVLFNSLQLLAVL